jgi:hypothetical protein
MIVRAGDARVSGTGPAPEDYALSRTTLLLGIVALVSPFLTGVFVYVANVGKDIGTLLIGSAIVLSSPCAIIANLWVLWRMQRSPIPLRGRWRAMTGLLLGLFSSCIYTIGGLVFFFLLRSVLRHD